MSANREPARRPESSRTPQPARVSERPRQPERASAAPPKERRSERPAAGKAPAGKRPAPRHEEHRGQNWLRDVILGGQDGLVNVLGIVLGVIAGGGSTTVLIATGIAASITESISMGAVGYTSTVSERDYYLSELERENWEIDHLPDVEREEIREIFAAKGFEGELLEQIVDVITSNREQWLQTMMNEELHLQPVGDERVLRSAAVITIATLVGHLIPLAPFFFLPTLPALVAAIVAAGLVLFGVGVYSAVTLVGDWRRSGLQLVVIGLGAALLGFVVSSLFHTAAG